MNLWDSGKVWTGEGSTQPTENFIFLYKLVDEWKPKQTWVTLVTHISQYFFFFLLHVYEIHLHHRHPNQGDRKVSTAKKYNLIYPTPFSLSLRTNTMNQSLSK